MVPAKKNDPRDFSHGIFLQHLFVLECLFMQFQGPVLPLHILNLKSTR